MSRVLKFRAWHRGFRSSRTGKVFEPARMIYDEKPGDCLTWVNQGQSIEAVMQFTGLLDKNRKEIYEGDVVRSFAHFVDRDEAVEEIVEYVEGAFYPLCTMHGNQFEVIGNIYENPELTK